MLVRYHTILYHTLGPFAALLSRSDRATCVSFSPDGLKVAAITWKGEITTYAYDRIRYGMVLCSMASNTVKRLLNHHELEFTC